MLKQKHTEKLSCCRQYTESHRRWDVKPEPPDPQLELLPTIGHVCYGAYYLKSSKHPPSLTFFTLLGRCFRGNDDKDSLCLKGQESKSRSHSHTQAPTAASQHGSLHILRQASGLVTVLFLYIVQSSCSLIYKVTS